MTVFSNGREIQFSRHARFEINPWILRILLAKNGSNWPPQRLSTGRFMTEPRWQRIEGTSFGEGRCNQWRTHDTWNSIRFSWTKLRKICSSYYCKHFLSVRTVSVDKYILNGG
jgi:hypothetical protein